MKKQLSLILIGLVIAALLGYAIKGLVGLIFACLVLLVGFFIFHFIFVFQLYRWLKKPTLSTMPTGIGIWSEIFDALLKQAKTRKKSKQKLTDALMRFEQINQAMPNGIILLDKNGRMEWFNQSAMTHLKLINDNDEKGILKNIIRMPEFHHFLDEKEQNEINIFYQDTPLYITKTPIKNNKTLLISQDMTKSEQLNKTRTDFVANVSHELRTPLTVISGFTETLMDNDDLPREQQQQFLQLMKQENERMLNLIKDLLTLSKLEYTENEHNDKAIINLSDIIKTIITDAQNISQNQHQFITQIQDNIHIFGVEMDIYNALSNLVFNAVRYTPSQGEIFVNLQTIDGQEKAEFSVRDTGVGIAREHIPRLTERFYRVSEGRHKQTGGTGLGLAITKHALAKHHSELLIESEVGVGSIFSAQFDVVACD